MDLNKFKSIQWLDPETGEKTEISRGIQHKYGIVQLKAAAAAIGGTWLKIRARGKNGFTWLERALSAVNISTTLGDVLSEIETLKKEIEDLSPEEAAKVVQYLTEKLEIAAPLAIFIVSNVIPETLKIVFSSIKIYRDFKEYFNE